MSLFRKASRLILMTMNGMTNRMKLNPLKTLDPILPKVWVPRHHFLISEKKSLCSIFTC